jgi:hypothetical protein
LRTANIILVVRANKKGAREIEMSEQRSLWQRLFGSRGSSSLSQRQQKELIGAAREQLGESFRSDEFKP